MRKILLVALQPISKSPRKFKIALSRPELHSPIFWLRGPTNRLRLISDPHRAGKYAPCRVGAVVNDIRKITQGYVITVH